jgi:hypothetical protein
MNSMKKNIYNGLNPIYESLIKESESNSPSTEPTDVISSVSTILNTLFSILLNSKMQNAKTPRGFEEIKNKIMGVTNFGSFRQYIISLLESLGAMDVAQKEAYKKNIQFVSELFSKIEPLVSDQKMFKALKEDTIAKLLKNFEDDLKERETQIKKTSPELLSQMVKKGLVVKEAKRSPDTTDVEDEASRSRAFNKSRDSLDAATAFVGEIDRDKYEPNLKDNADIQRYKEIADGLFKKAQDLQMTDRQGIKVVTPSGTIKRGEYMKQQDSLLNEIIRQKREYKRVKDTILKGAGLTPPPVVDPICPPGKTFDANKGICVSVQSSGGGGDEQKPSPAPSKECEFPVQLKTKCNEVGSLQSRLMELIPSVKSYLSGKGGADKVYGKGTAAASNVVWGYLSNNYGQELTSPLTREMYNAIMALKPEDIDVTVSTTNLVDSKKWEMSVFQKIEEREQIKRSKVLSFSDFFDVIDESYAFARMDEEDKVEAAAAVKKLKDSCIKDSLEQGKVVDCKGIGKSEDDTKKEEEKGPAGPPTREEWGGLKYVKTGSYPVSFDESLLSAWSKEIAITALSFALPGSGYLLKAGSTGLRSLSIRGAAEIGAEKLAKRLAGEAATKSIGQRVATSSPVMRSVAARLATTKTPSTVANQLSTISSGFFRRYGKVLIPKRLASGLIGGTLGAATLDFISGRNSYVITVTEGYIERSNLLGVVNGLIDTIDGYVSDDDWATIATVAAVIKGSYTIDEDGNAISSWEFIKQKYQGKEGESLTEDINSVKPKMGEVEGFPKLKSSSPLSSLEEISWRFAKEELVSFIKKLDSNESKLAENLKKLPKNYLEALEEGDFAEYDEEGNVEGIEELEGDAE